MKNFTMIVGALAMATALLAAPQTFAAQGQIVDVNPSGVVTIIDRNTEQEVQTVAAAGGIFGDPDFDLFSTVEFVPVCSKGGGCFAIEVNACPDGVCPSEAPSASGKGKRR